MDYNMEKFKSQKLSDYHFGGENEGYMSKYEGMNLMAKVDDITDKLKGLLEA